MYELTAEEFDLTPKEVEVLIKFRETAEWQLLERLEKTILLGAQSNLDNATDIHTILRAQGEKLFWRRRQEAFDIISERAKLEEEGIEDE